MASYSVCLGALAAAMSIAPEAKAIVSLLEARYAARTLQATFLESYTENGRTVRAESGTVYFRRPGKMRWEYEAPEKNVFLVDGKTAWFYVPADRTVTRVPAKESTDWRTPLALLAGEMKLSRVCKKIAFASDEPPTTPSDAMLDCQLRGRERQAKGEVLSRKAGATEPGESVYLEVVASSGELVRIVVKDSGGIRIEFRFAKWQTDPHVDDSFFRFQVPAGVAIVNGELATGEK